MGACILHEVLFEVVGDFAFVLHAHERLGPARVATALVDRRALKDGHSAAGFGGRQSGRQARDSAARHDDIIVAIGQSLSRMDRVPR